MLHMPLFNFHFEFAKFFRKMQPRERTLRFVSHTLEITPTVTHPHTHSHIFVHTHPYAVMGLPLILKIYRAFRSILICAICILIEQTAPKVFQLTAFMSATQKLKTNYTLDRAKGREETGADLERVYQ